jgi:hypothetical protein
MPTVVADVLGDASRGARLIREAAQYSSGTETVRLPSPGASC